MPEREDFQEANRLFSAGQYGQALDFYLRLAENGSRSQRFLGWMYYAGEGTERNIDRALDWFKRAADAGDIEAKFGIARVHLLKKEYEIARKWLISASEYGYTPALYRLGWIYYHGRGVPADVHKAVGFWREASRKGHLKSRKDYALALMKGGLGVGKRFPGLLLYAWAVVSIIYFALTEGRGERFMH